MTYLYSGIKVTSENNNFQLSNAKLSLYTYFQKHTSKISWKLILLLVLAISFQLDSNAQSNITTNDNGGETIQSSPAKNVITESDASIKEKEKQASKQKEALKQNDALKNTEALKQKEGAISEKEAILLKEKSKQEQKRIADTKSLKPFYLLMNWYNSFEFDRLPSVERFQMTFSNAVVVVVVLKLTKFFFVPKIIIPKSC